ncbi:hypothetical protein BV25DRAFT_915611 [Artomyces pyxidatus]|uniref:Uncharacterized protein n=1 Tax=Artomyces pyxidatus TaxID=48021 RepID=A0ACB8SD05_9AGAM|nr:hypothetical protein BV25DRAFT_915611 [Artomyces pyxidatus]
MVGTNCLSLALQAPPNIEPLKYRQPLQQLEKNIMPAAAHFPAHSWLGNSINMTAITPSDITSVTKAVLSAVRFIDLAPETAQQVVAGVTYDVPTNCTIADDVTSGDSSYRTYVTGSDAASDFEVNSDVSVKYMAVSGSVDASYAIAKTFHHQYQYAIFAYDSTLFMVSFEDYMSHISSAKLKVLTAGLLPFDPTNAAVVNAYRRFFQNAGTHVIVGCNYGARFQLNVWASNENSSVNKNWGVNVTAAFNGLVASGQFDLSIKSSDQYKQFSGYMQKSVSCFGGDPAIAGQLATEPQADAVYQRFTDWSKTARNTPDVMSLALMEMWNIMSLASDPEVSARANDIQNAFKWITAHPRTHRTKCRLSISSDWGEIGLLTPSAFILNDPEGAVLPTGIAVFNGTKIRWGEEFSYAYNRDVAIDFLIENDGSPVDIQLSHGSLGKGNMATGRISVVIHQTTKVNDKIGDNYSNTTFEYTIAVNPNVVV